MKKTKRVAQLVIFGALMFVCNASCSVLNSGAKSDTGCNSVDLYGEAAIATGFYQQALDAYAEEQSAENCKELQASGNEYIKALEAYRDCVPEDKVTNDNQIKVAKAALADLDC